MTRQEQPWWDRFYFAARRRAWLFYAALSFVIGVGLVVSDHNWWGLAFIAIGGAMLRWRIR